MIIVICENCMHNCPENKKRKHVSLLRMNTYKSTYLACTQPMSSRGAGGGGRQRLAWGKICINISMHTLIYTIVVGLHVLRINIHD